MGCGVGGAVVVYIILEYLDLVGVGVNLEGFWDRA